MSSKHSSMSASIVALLVAVAAASRIRSPGSLGYAQASDQYYDDYARYGFDDYYGRLNRPPCPRYEPLRVSAARNQLTFDVSMPGVRKQDMDASLSNDLKAIHVKGFRTLPARGRACLPAEATVSADGRYEILEGTLPLPAHGDATKVEMDERHQGMRITIPQRVAAKSSYRNEQKRPDARAQKNAGARQSTKRTGATQSSDGTPYMARVRSRGAAAGSSEAGSSTARARSHTPAPRLTEPKVRPVVDLPPAHGVQIDDDEFPWPEERFDASAGWLDNRGLFQSY